MAPVLPKVFQFSQTSLQDYVDCPRRFLLRYVLQLDWPAEEAEPALENERRQHQGAAFHRLIHQHLLGIPAERLSATVQDDDLRRWWDNYLEHGLQELPQARYPEVVMSAPLSKHRLIAKYDLVAIEPGRRAIIVDWKTSQRRSRQKTLAERLQTKIYPYILSQAGAHLNNDQLLIPEQIEMVYWFADYPDDPAQFAYDAAQRQADEDYLTSLIEEIAGLSEEDFPTTSRAERCDFCPYRSFCQRGVKAGSIDAFEDDLSQDDFDISLDFEQIAEIEY
jgi:CRISPR/Cas system-associated exonuclease Cas4 (RecB family)